MSATQRGFTRIEWIVGGVMVLMVAWYTVPRVSAWHAKAEREAAQEQICRFVRALQQYADDNGAPPTTQQGLDALIHAPRERPRATHWRKYLEVEQIPLDPWGNPYHYESPANGAPFDVVSYGKGCNGTCEEEEITSEPCLAERRERCCD